MAIVSRANASAKAHRDASARVSASPVRLVETAPPRPKRWGAAESSILTSPRYIRFLAETHPELRISADRFDVPSFIAPLDVREPMRAGPIRGLAEALFEVAPSWVAPPSLFLGTPFERYNQSYLLDAVTDPCRLREKAVRYAQQHDIQTIVMTNVSVLHPRLEPWLDAGFVSLPSFPDTLVDLDVDQFDAHLLRLTQGDRSGVRRNIKRFQRRGYTLDRVRDSAPLADVLYAAYRPMFERATVRWQPHTRAYFGGLSRLGEDVRLTVARSAEGQVVGFVVNFRDGEDFQAGRVGVLPRWHRQDAVYFRLMYRAIEEAVALGGGRGGRLSLEPTGYRMKRHLGARRQPLVNLVYGVSARWATLLSRFAGFGRHLLRHLADEAELERAY